MHESRTFYPWGYRRRTTVILRSPAEWALSMVRPLLFLVTFLCSLRYLVQRIGFEAFSDSELVMSYQY